MNPITKDTLIEDRLVLWQNKNGYRFSIDSVILAHFVRPKPGDQVIDFGTGCGILPVLLAYRHPDIRITGCEIQTSLFRLAKKNGAHPLFENRIEICHQDIKALNGAKFEESYDSVVCNPPYTAHHAGRVNPVAEKAIARHELCMTATDLVAAAAGVLKKDGVLYMIYPFKRQAALLDIMAQQGFFPVLVQDICTRPGQAPKLFLIKAARCHGDAPRRLDTLTIYDEDHRYTDEVARYFSPRGY